MDDRCVVCGEIIPEVRMVCPICEQGDSVDARSGSGGDDE